MNKLILVEGIPGSGKTTISRKIADYLGKSIKTTLYNEGQMHPADLAWCACIPEGDYEGIIKTYPQYENPIRENTWFEDGYAIVAYIQFPIEDQKLYAILEGYEVYDGKAGLEVFTGLHAKRWRRFSEQAGKQNGITVFECSFLQNHINELLLFHNLDEDTIIKHLCSLIDSVRTLNPVLFYLVQPCVRETIARVSAQRVDEEGRRVWMERVIQYTEKCPYGLKNGLKGFDGMVKAFEDRKRIEMRVIRELPIETHIIDNPDYDWDKVWGEVEKKLKAML